MERVMVVGPFNSTMREALREAFPLSFQLEYLTSYEEYDRLRQADYVILRTLEIKGDSLEKLEQCKLIQRWGAGFDSVDIKAAGEHGIGVAVTAGINATPVSEMALALMLAVYRNLVPMTNHIMDGKWEREEFSKRSYTISGKRVGVFGIGNIGRKVSALCRAFGAEVLYYDPYRLPREREEELQVTYCGQETLWKSSDIITLHSPLTDSTRCMVNKNTLSMMKAGSVLINTARSELVDLDALAEALKEGRLLGAGLDAVEETITGNNPLKGLPNVVMTAHLGGNTVENSVHMARRCAQQICAVSAGEKLLFPHLVNGEYLTN